MIEYQTTTSNNKHYSSFSEEELLNQPIQQFGAAVTKKKPKELNPDTQQAILEVQTVREIQNKVDYANAFIMRYQRISPLQLEDAV